MPTERWLLQNLICFTNGRENRQLWTNINQSDTRMIVYMYKIIITGVSKYNDKYDEQIVGLRKKCGMIGFVIGAESMN